MPELVFLLFAAGVFFAWRWWTVWRVGQLRKSLAQALVSRYIVHLSDDSVSCERPDGTVEQVAWDDLQRVDALSTPDGPLLPDKFWVLIDSNSRCAIPLYATNGEALFRRLVKLPNFGTAHWAEPKTCELVETCWQKATLP